MPTWQQYDQLWALPFRKVMYRWEGVQMNATEVTGGLGSMIHGWDQGLDQGLLRLRPIVFWSICTRSGKDE